jgi:hypothetical protein
LAKETTVSINTLTIDYISINDEKVVRIQKSKVNDKQVVTTEWSFNLNRVYEEHITLPEVYENEVVCSDYYSSVARGMKGTFIFVSKSCDTFNYDPKKSDDTLNEFIRLNLRELFESVGKNSDLFVTVSFIDISNKIRDHFNFDTTGYSQTKILEYEDEISLEGVKEIQIKSVEQYDCLMSLVHEKYNKSKMLKKGEQYSELFTIKLYRNSKITNTLVSKFNFLLYKGYTIETDQKSSKAYSINTKENFNFFNALNSNNFRLNKLSKITRVS